MFLFWVGLVCDGGDFFCEFYFDVGGDLVVVVFFVLVGVVEDCFVLDVLYCDVIWVWFCVGRDVYYFVDFFWECDSGGEGLYIFYVGFDIGMEFFYF